MYRYHSSMGSPLTGGSGYPANPARPYAFAMARWHVGGKKFITAFPESERGLREAHWRAASSAWRWDGA